MRLVVKKIRRKKETRKNHKKLGLVGFDWQGVGILEWKRHLRLWW